MKAFVIILLMLFFTNINAQEIDIPAIVGKNPILGMGYDSEKEIRRGECITGTVVEEGKPISTANLTMMMNEKALEKDLGLAAGFRYRSGVTTTSASANFVKNSKESSYSTSAIFKGDYTFKDKILSKLDLSPLGRKLEKNPDRFKKTCGDHFTIVQSYGAKIYFSIRIDFKTAESKQEFNAKFSLSSPSLDVNADFKLGKKEFSKDTKITVSALQIGGDVTKLTRIFNNPNGGSTGKTESYNFVQCSFGDLQKCEEVLASAIDYATNTENGFPSTIASNPALIKSIVADYETAGVFVDFTPEMNKTIEAARKTISDTFEKSIAQHLNTVSILKNGVMRLSPRQRDKFTKMKATTYDNMVLLSEMSMECFDKPRECLTIAKNTNYLNNPDLIIYIESDFEVSPEIFAQFCDIGINNFTKREYSNTVRALVNAAYINNPDLFKDDGGTNDFCYKAQKELLGMKEVDLSLERMRVDFSQNSGVPFSREDERLVRLTGLLPFKSLTHFSEINLKDNKVKHLESFHEFENLTKLDLSYNNLEDVALLGPLTSLEVLDISGNAIFDLSALTNLNGIRYVYLTNNEHEVSCPFVQKSKCILIDYATTNALQFIDRRKLARRWGHRAVKLDNGDIYIFGGRFDPKSRYPEIFSSHSENFTKLLNPMARSRYHHNATKIGSNKVLIAGGWGALTHAEIFDAESKRFTSLSSMPKPMADQRDIVLDDGTVLFTGGWRGDAGTFTGLDMSNHAVLFDPKTNKFEALPSMNIPRVGHSVTKLKDGSILIVGGHGPRESLNSLEIYYPKTKNFKLLPIRLRYGRSFHSAHMIRDDEVIIIGGYFKDLKATDMIESINLKTGKIKLLRERLKTARAHHASVKLSNGTILLLGGTKRLQHFISENQEDSYPVRFNEILDPIMNMSFEISHKTYYNRVESSATALDSKRILFLGGKGPDGSQSASLFDYNL